MEIDIDCGKYNLLEVKASYTKGGMNYFAGGETPRGIHIHVQPFEVKDTGLGFQSKSCILFDKSAFKTFVLPMKRANKKKLAEVAAVIETLPQDEIAEMYLAGNRRGIVDMIHGALGA